jgi:hypothetical protein
MVELTDQPDPAPKAFHRDRASSRTAEEREAHYQAWLAKHGEPYAAAVIAAGDKPWTDDQQERLGLYLRRYDKSTAVIW